MARLGLAGARLRLLPMSRGGIDIIYRGAAEANERERERRERKERARSNVVSLIEERKTPTHLNNKRHANFIYISRGSAATYKPTRAFDALYFASCALVYPLRRSWLPFSTFLLAVIVNTARL